MTRQDSVGRSRKAKNSVDHDFGALEVRDCLATFDLPRQVITGYSSRSFDLSAEVLGLDGINTPPATNQIPYNADTTCIGFPRINEGFGCLQSSAPYPICRGLDSGVDLQHIARLQKHDGSWDWDQRLLDVLGTNPNPGTRDAVVATALAIAFMKKHMAHDAETWELIVQKARDWLGQQHGVNVEKEISDAEKLLDASTIRPKY
ncbi:hypothetical protein RRF57_007640 [Xylaria bambusicola]|uniref:Uncharacterized protein n=1 Tax=Xylaria bambusicola TaxID=326684 RepID=A0AAN7ZAJ9_9PEZI